MAVLVPDGVAPAVRDVPLTGPDDLQIKNKALVECEGPWDCIIIFTALVDSERKQSKMHVALGHFHPSLMFVGKAKSPCPM